MRPIKPDVGHLVRIREGSALARDISALERSVYVDEISQAWRGYGIVVATRGIEIQVLLPGELFPWVRRDNVEVISETR
jgi:hypothetical protein